MGEMKGVLKGGMRILNRLYLLVVLRGDGRDEGISR